MNLETMTVGELISELQNFDEDLPVVANVNYGDRARTQQAIPITELGHAFCVDSSYSESGYAVKDTSDDEPENNVVSLNFDALF
ncbi:hypothetical protein [Marisediminitalea sp.]|uniref:hypothetical protein n=1 Tax=Marisediminitalea sp. TaxID=2662268 RepID=UPI003513B1E6